MWFPLFCIVSAGSALGIVYVLFGPAKTRPLAPVSRIRASTVPAAPSQRYEPERVFATISRVPMRGSAPPPIPRSRVARGSDAPPLRNPTTREPNPFERDDATLVGEIL